VAIFREISGHLQKTLEEERELNHAYSAREAAHKESMGRERALQNLEVEALTRRPQRRAKQIVVAGLLVLPEKNGKDACSRHAPSNEFLGSASSLAGCTLLTCCNRRRVQG